MNGNVVFGAGLVAAGGIGFLAAQQGFGSVHPLVPVASILLISLPSFFGLIRVIGWGRGLSVLAGLGVFALLVEALGVWSGFPYGSFQYTGDLGWRVFGLVPWTVPFAWIPLLLGAVALAGDRISGTVQRGMFAALLLTAMDFVLDPGAVSVGLWRYSFPGVYYEVPWTNFAGWMLSGTLAAVMLSRALNGKSLPFQMLVSAAWMVAFWTGVAGARVLVLPFLIGVSIVGYIFYRYTRRS
jgi:putative membrane protein